MLPDGVGLSRLAPHRDARGTFTELFRSSWGLDVEPVQWNVVHSDGHVLRGVHAHHRHSDYLTIVSGRATIGLHDLRADSPTRGLGTVVELDSDAPAGLTIPPGVAHGFYLQTFVSAASAGPARDHVADLGKDRVGPGVARDP